VCPLSGHEGRDESRPYKICWIALCVKNMNYDFRNIEKKWQEQWASARIFETH